MVEDFVKPAELAKFDIRHFGTVPGFCTTHALLSMLHSWLSAKDGNGTTVRTVLFDFHPEAAVVGAAFQSPCLDRRVPICRRQRVKLSQDCFSEWGGYSIWDPSGDQITALALFLS